MGYTLPPRVRRPSGLSSPLRVIDHARPELGLIEPSEDNIRRACMLAGYRPGAWPPPFYRGG